MAIVVVVCDKICGIMCGKYVAKFVVKLKNCQIGETKLGPHTLCRS